jgi:hypothetical protein
MAQAETNLTTRRGFSKWLAGMGAATLIPATAKAEAVSKALTDGSKEVEGKWSAWIVAREHVAECEALIKRWEKRNPYPDSDDDKYKMEKYWAVLANDRSAWHDRRIVVLRKSGVGKAKLKANAEADELREAVSRFSNIKCAGIADLLFKTEASIHLDDDESMIANAIVCDLLHLHNIEVPD